MNALSSLCCKIVLKTVFLRIIMPHFKLVTLY